MTVPTIHGDGVANLVENAVRHNRPAAGWR
jgi:hypothetical protein